jgi:O-succinylbenzoic acid--CoA ligase
MILESWLARAAATAPQRIAVQDGERDCSYTELYAAAAAGAAQLERSGVQRGQRVAIALPPGIPFAIALHACWLAGAVAVPVDTRLSATEQDAISAGAALVLAQPLRDFCSDEVPEVVAARIAGPVYGGFTLGANPLVKHDLDAVAVVIHTSGTASQPRPVELTFGNLLWSALGSGVALGVDPAERWLCTLPVCHIGGLSILVRSAIFATTAVLHKRFETQRALKAVMEQEITLISLVATTLGRLLDAGLQRPPALRCALAGGGPVPAALLERAAEAGVPVCQTYGLTEACSQVSTVPLAALTRHGDDGGAPLGVDRVPGADGPFEIDESLGAGRPLFCTRVRIAAEGAAIDGESAPAPREPGEVLVAGPTVAESALGEDGWLHTGDLGMLDADGNLHVTGRKADTIISGGENVAPAEVEAALEAHRQVAEAAVIARSDPQWGEAVTAIVVPYDGERPSEQELRRHCAQRLAAYKVPKRVVLVDSPLPRTRSGKLLRRELTSGGFSKTIEAFSEHDREEQP